MLFLYTNILFTGKIILLFCFSEASKVIMQYVAAVSGKGQDIDRVKEQLLQSNPVLEGDLLYNIWRLFKNPDILYFWFEARISNTFSAFKEDLGE